MLTALIMMILSMIPMITSLIMLILNKFISFKIPLITFMTLELSVDIITDWTSMMFLGTVMLISSLIIMFSIYYIPQKEHIQFLLLLMMFVLSMTFLILSNNIFLILLGWDGLGLSSYVLVVYYQNYITSACGSITLLSNRVGDIMILLSISILMLLMNWNFSMNKEFLTLPLIFLMIAACSKSAQLPFSAWLPMAMAAPTPISALVHSSTLVTAGVFLLIRIMNIPHPTLLLSLMIISSLTAFYASMSASWEQDLKKIIALSTLSQIAMMMFSISINSVTLAFSHLIIHALFKSTMFLCAGVMIHESSYQDMRMIKQKFNTIPIVHSTFGITTMTLMGMPFLSGFFSKDAIIEKLISSKLECSITILMILSIGMTATYSLRMLFMTNKSMFSSNPNQSNHSTFFFNMPLMLITPMVVMSGSWMMWTLTSEQTFMMNNFYKILIISNLMLGVFLGMSLKFKHKMYLLMGLSSVSLWYTHFLSTISVKLLSSPMHIFMKSDQQWQETYGPQKSFKLSKLLSITPELSKTSILSILTLMTMTPLLLMK